MDGFDKKRQMVKVLMDMLKKNASDEVTGPPASQMSEEANDEPEEGMPAELPEEPGAEHPAPVMGEIEEEDEDNNSSAFDSFLPRRKK